MRKGIGPRGLGAVKSPLKQAASSREITEGSFGKSSKNAKDTSGDPRISGHNERLKSGMVEKDNRPPVVEDKSIASFNGKKHYTVTGEAQRSNTSSRQDNTSPAKQTRIGRRGPDDVVRDPYHAVRSDGGLGKIADSLVRNTKQPTVKLKPKKASIPLQGKEAKLKK